MSDEPVVIGSSAHAALLRLRDRLSLLQIAIAWASAFSKPVILEWINALNGALGIGYNTELLKKRGIPAPKCWADLLDPKLRDEVQIADPNSSGTAYVFLATTVQRLGEEKGFEYLKALHKNINQYTKSGIAPVKATALGETTVGIAFIHDMLTQKLQGAPIETVAPCEGTGYETGSVSIIKGGRNPEAARRFVDFTLSPEAQNINAKLKINSIPSNRNTTLSPDAPNFSEMKLIDYDTPRWGSPAERSWASISCQWSSVTSAGWRSSSHRTSSSA